MTHYIDVRTNGIVDCRPATEPAVHHRCTDGYLVVAASHEAAFAAAKEHDLWRIRSAQGEVRIDG